MATMTRTLRRALSGLVFVCVVGTTMAAQQTATTPQPPAAPGRAADSEADQEVERIVSVEADEELQQLIAQAEALAGPESPATAEAIALIREELEALKTGLSAKAALLDEGRDTTEADLEIASRTEGLQAAIAAVTEQESALDSAPSDQQPKEDRSSVIAQVDSYVGEALSLLGKIQELLAIRRDEGAGAEPAGAELEASDDAGGSDEVLQDVTGVVTEGGEPLAGVSVTDPESDVTAVTDSEGQYTLHGVPAGRLANLVLSKGGAQLGEGRLDLPSGRDSVGDFDLRSSGERSRPALRVLPAVVVVAGAKTPTEQRRGSLRGTLRDANGRPVPRALVSLGRLARARTDSRGQYAFLNVPAGAHELKVSKPGFPIESQRVRVAATRLDVPISLRPRSSKSGSPARPLLRTGSGTQMRGAVTSAAGPLRAARVTLIRSGNAASVKSGSRGDFRFRDLEAGRYRVVVSKAGYRSLAETVSLEQGTSLVRNYQLTRTARTASVVSRAKTGGAAPAAVRTKAVATGRVVGRVFHAKTRKPVPGALVAIEGQKPVRTNAAGSYRITDVSPARHHVVVKADGFATADRNIRVAGARVTRLDFGLTPDRPGTIGSSRLGGRAALGLLVGRVLDGRTRRPIVSVVVSVGGTKVTTDRTGNFRVPGLRRGAHRVVLDADGYQQRSETVTLGPDDETTVTFTLMRVVNPARRR